MKLIAIDLNKMYKAPDVFYPLTYMFFFRYNSECYFTVKLSEYNFHYSRNILASELNKLYIRVSMYTSVMNGIFNGNILSYNQKCTRLLKDLKHLSMSF